MKIYGKISNQANAIPYYRTVVPLQALADLELAECMLDNNDPAIDDDSRYSTMFLADLFYAPFIMAHPQFQTFEPFLRIKQDPESGLIPPTTVVDLDDDMWHISPTNPSYFSWGYRNFDGEIIKPGEVIKVQLPDGSDHVLWNDGEVTLTDTPLPWSAGLCLANMAAANRFLKTATGITTTSEYLKQRIIEETGHANVYVHPNTIYFPHYDEVELREHPGEIRILISGGASHHMDLQHTIKPLQRVLRKYKHAKLLVFGQEWQFFQSQFDTDQFKFIEWVPLERYRLRLATLGHDIAVIPLSHDKFNEGKSPIKWYESTAISRPAACLASDYGPFRREMEDGVTGLLYNSDSEFETKLSQLIEDETLRRELASNSVDWLHENRDAMKLAPPHYDWLQECLVLHKQNREAYALSNSVCTASSDRSELGSSLQESCAGSGESG